jgi:seryl-tRNA synthetase
MLDIRRFREDPESVRVRLARRGGRIEAFDRIADLDTKRRSAITAGEELKARKNAASKEVGRIKQAKAATTEAAALAEALMAEVRSISAEIEARDKEAAESEVEIERILLEIPNTPDDAIPDSGNQVMKSLGLTPEGREAHWDIATRLGLCDFDRGAKLAGARFYVLIGAGARLERALISFMLDKHLHEHGYTEVMPPLLVNIESMTGTGQYPKFAEEYFTCERDGLSLIPTAEVPVTNLHRDEILEELPRKYVAYTPCFRREAGSYGKDTRGLVRVHQFNKVEIVQFVRPEDSPAAHESLTRDAERILEALELPYRRVLLAADDIGFSAAKTYDLEIWMPGLNRYLEVSSCSNFTDYQARRMKIRFRREPKGKPELVHTLNGSGLAIGRTWAAILENNLQPDGTVVVPSALRPYMGGMEKIG